MRGVSGENEHNNYLFHLGFMLGQPNPTGKEMKGNLYIFNQEIQGPELNLSDAGFEVLLGMDVIGKGSLAVEGNGTFSFSF